MNSFLDTFFDGFENRYSDALKSPKVIFCDDFFISYP